MAKDVRQFDLDTESNHQSIHSKDQEILPIQLSAKTIKSFQVELPYMTLYQAWQAVVKAGKAGFATQANWLGVWLRVLQPLHMIVMAWVIIQVMQRNCLHRSTVYAQQKMVLLVSVLVDFMLREMSVGINLDVSASLQLLLAGLPTLMIVLVCCFLLRWRE